MEKHHKKGIRREFFFKRKKHKQPGKTIKLEE